MSTTVTGLSSSLGVTWSGPVHWGDTVHCQARGVYIVALPEPIVSAPVQTTTLNYWVKCASKMTVHGQKASNSLLLTTLGNFWHSDEVILYIGRAGSVLAGISAGATISDRVHAYYGTRLGAHRPHRGGYWIKVLSILHTLLVYWSPAPDPQALEKVMLQAFIRNRSGSDPNDLPFANLRNEYSHQIKQHGIRKPSF